MKQKLVVVLGPTAVGKTKFAVQLAHQFNGEIISADSRQVYRGMTIGTGKDLDEYKINNLSIPYHLIDVVNPSEEYNLYQFKKDFKNSFDIIAEKGKNPFLVGGTGLYIHSLLMNYNLNTVNFDSPRNKFLSALSDDELLEILSNLNPQLHNTTDTLNRDRMIKAILIAEGETTQDKNTLEMIPFVIGIREERQIIKDRITTRLKSRLKNGMIEEIEKLISDGISFDKLDFFGLEYRFIGKYLQGELTYNDMYQKLNSAIHKFAKRQMTWFRKMEREGIDISWLNFNELEKGKTLVAKYLKK